MSAHTRGPWRALPEEDVNHYVRVRGTRLGSKYKIANVHLPDYANPISADVEEARANARLIATAPELLEALKMALDHAIFPGDSISSAHQKARAAIAKATGEQA